MSKRLSKINYYMNIAKEVAQRATCFRVKIGAVIVKDDQIVATGYVGAPRKTKDCLEHNLCLRNKLNIPHGQRYEMCRSVHAEQNAIINAARAGTSILDGDMYIYGENDQGEKIDTFPCFICKKMIVNAGLCRVIVGLKNSDLAICEVNQWINDWQQNDIIDDKQQYGQPNAEQPTANKPIDQPTANPAEKNNPGANPSLIKLNQPLTKIVAIVGLCGAGKSLIADKLVAHGYQFIRFGQITLDEVKKRGLEPTEKVQKEIREEFRKKHGMAAFAILNAPKIDEFLKNGPVVIDGLYSWSEYKVLKDKYGDRLTIIAVYARPETRYQRISQRRPDVNDTDLRQHHFTVAEAQSRDYAEIENIEKGGPIVMADYTLINEGTPEELYRQLEACNL